MDALDCIDPKAILIVDTDGLKASPEDAQGVMDAIDEHYGLPRMRHVQAMPNRADNAKPEPNSRHMRGKLKNETIQYVRTTMRSQTKQFVDLLEQPGKIMQKSLLWSKS